jgi:hypothetical protein
MGGMKTSSRPLGLAAGGVAGLAACLAAGLILLSGCPQTVTLGVIQRQKDQVKPLVLITQPADGSSYPATVVVTGKASDSIDAAGHPGKVSALRWDLTPATIAGADVTSTLAGDGSFSFQFPTAALTGTILLTVTATDWNGNKGGSSITLSNGGAVPSFSATAGNHQIAFSWSPVPLAASYSLYYTSNGTPPNAATSARIDNVSPGYILPSLQNGALYSLLLQAHSSSGPDNWSGIVKAIPLSPQSLAPQVSTGQYGQVSLSWKAMAANSPVSVWRSPGSAAADFFDLTGPITGSSYVDYSVSPGQSYWYEVMPASFSPVASAAVAGMASPLASLNRRITNTWSASQASDVTYIGSYVAVLDGVDDLVRIFNIGADPALAGSPAASFNAFGGSGSATVASWDGGSTLIVAGKDGSGFAKVANVNVGSPASPSVRGSASLGGSSGVKIYDVKTWNGSLAFVAEGSQGVQVVDYTTATPVLKGSYNSSIDARGLFPVRLSTGTSIQLFVASYNLGLLILDVPATGASFSLESLSGTSFPVSLQWPTAVAVSGTRMWVADQGLGLVDITATISGTFPMYTNYARAGSLQLQGAANHLATDIADNLVYVASGDQGLQIVNVLNFAQPSLYDSYAIPAGKVATRVTQAGPFTYLSDGSVEVVNPNLQIDSLSPIDAGFYSIGVSGTAASGPALLASDVKVQGSTAYVAGSSGLGIYDVSNPTSPSLLGSLVQDLSRGHLAISGNYAYVAAWTSGLQIFDVSIPSAPVLAGSFSLGAAERARDLCLYGDYALVADQGNGLLVIDVSRPASPSLVARYPTPSSAVGLRLAGTTLYVFDTTDLLILDMSDPSHPGMKGEWRSFYNSNGGGDLQGNYAFVTNGFGLLVIDVSNPLNPVQKAAAYASSESPYRVKIAGTMAFVASGAGGQTGGIQVFDITDPLVPVFKGFHYESNVTTTVDEGLDVYGSSLWLADDQGLKSLAIGYAAVP